MPCMRLAYTVGLTCLWEVCRTWHMRCQLLPLRVRDHSLVNRALTYSIFLCFSWPIYLAKEQELDISKWYLILQEVRESHRPHARMGPSPKAFSIWIFEKKAQRNKIFFYLKVMGTSTRTRLYISKRSIWIQRSWKFFHRSGSPNQELSLLSFESLKYHQFSLTMVAGCVWKKKKKNPFFSNTSISYFKFKNIFIIMLFKILNNVTLFKLIYIKS